MSVRLSESPRCAGLSNGIEDLITTTLNDAQESFSVVVLALGQHDRKWVLVRIDLEAGAWPCPTNAI